MHPWKLPKVSQLPISKETSFPSSSSTSSEAVGGVCGDILPLTPYGLNLFIESCGCIEVLKGLIFVCSLFYLQR
jgi:hypothetical protein